MAFASKKEAYVNLAETMSDQFDIEVMVEQSPGTLMAAARVFWCVFFNRKPQWGKKIAAGFEEHAPSPTLSDVFFLRTYVEVSVSLCRLDSFNCVN